MSLFKVGEVVIVDFAIMHPEATGMECEILSELTFHEIGMVHLVQVQGLPHPTYSLPAHLRKRKPPQELSSWEAIQALTNWHPEKVEA